MAPRRAGTSTSASCWVAAACLSVPALTTPSQAERAAPMTSRPRKTAKSSPIRRSTSFISARGRGCGAGVRARRGGRERLRRGGRYRRGRRRGRHRGDRGRRGGGRGGHGGLGDDRGHGARRERGGRLAAVGHDLLGVVAG